MCLTCVPSHEGETGSHLQIQKIKHAQYYRNTVNSALRWNCPSNKQHFSDNKHFERSELIVCSQDNRETQENEPQQQCSTKVWRSMVLKSESYHWKWNAIIFLAWTSTFLVFQTSHSYHLCVCESVFFAWHMKLKLGASFSVLHPCCFPASSINRTKQSAISPQYYWFTLQTTDKYNRDDI